MPRNWSPGSPGRSATLGVFKEPVIAKTQRNTWAKKVREQEAKQKAADKRAKRQNKRDDQREAHG
jgi:hypothetical protein